jgi:hypothetical protein
MLVLGDVAQMTMQVDNDPACPLWFSVPAHVARRNRVAAGERIAVSLLTAGNSSRELGAAASLTTEGSPLVRVPPTHSKRQRRTRARQSEGVLWRN